VIRAGCGTNVAAHCTASDSGGVPLKRIPNRQRGIETWILSHEFTVNLNERQGGQKSHLGTQKIVSGCSSPNSHPRQEMV
jgi:hypothetical protein